LSFHGLRKTASAWLAEAGATDAEIDSILGHVDPKMTRLYRRQADQRITAKSAMGKLAGRRIAKA
jgi:integrase